MKTSIPGAIIYLLFHFQFIYIGGKAIREKRFKSKKWRYFFRSQTYEVVGSKAVFWGKAYVVGGTLMLGAPVLATMLTVAFGHGNPAHWGIAIWLLGLGIIIAGNIRAL